MPGYRKDINILKVVQRQTTKMISSLKYILLYGLKVLYRFFIAKKYTKENNTNVQYIYTRGGIVS